ncbi:hypothetical protein [Sphingomonas sp.]|uniref:hypothetical protein n=1 Tax=Sphingomonas sp. TaxID=28214 RepID=UPI001DE9440C|nr:hypothetical protein [Sphingomonas sp.]MBX9796464.1 hypothetical protein [Sphingomonas sp.]
MRAALIAGLVLVAAPAVARESLGVHGGWAAFRDASPRRCYAIAAPGSAGGRGRGFVTVATWPGGPRAQLYVRLSQPRSPNARVTISIGQRRFALTAGDSDAWAPDARADAAIIAAMRGGRAMSVETLGLRGVPFADAYALDGAATAIDAATLGCL